MAVETKPSTTATSDRTTATPRKSMEPPQVFYARLTQREDIRRLLTKLAKL